MLSEVLEKWGGCLESPIDLYADLFHLGEGFIQTDGEPPGQFKANPLIIGHADGRMHRKIMFEDTFEQTLIEFQGMDWAFMSPCTYFGRSNSADRQSKLYGFVFDLDGVTDESLNNFLFGVQAGAYPMPQHIVLSGHGVHVYYVLEEPLDLYPGIKTQAKELKYALTRMLWNRYTSCLKEVQYQGINQGFRVPGSRAKEGADVPICTAYSFGDHPTCIEELNAFVPKDSRIDVSCRVREARMTAADARERFPEWYARVVERGEPSGQWVCKRDLYDWWKRKVEVGATYGHRYFCIMALAIYAAKCGIYDRDEVRRDAMAMMPGLNGLDPNHPFTERDIDSALECLDGRYATFPRSDIAKLTDIDIPANKRNYRKRDQHMAVMRAIENVTDPDGEWRNKNGAPTKCDLVRDYAADHPDMNHSQIARALDVSRQTVIKWLRDV